MIFPGLGALLSHHNRHPKGLTLTAKGGKLLACRYSGGIPHISLSYELVWPFRDE